MRFTDWTRDGGIRHPTYLGLRDDWPPQKCRREAPDPDDWAGDLDPDLAGDRERRDGRPLHATRGRD